ncbi:hypothetical protein I6E81_12480 [Salinibacterium sp. NG22]|uniref:hypothetical protein n=1 Tax=Salinibacterium sp. NG22 TaxID=2792040 RepID=UPI0018CEE35F|nr:hypothetical protein [Salinibacterium sp. NG22]MBH0110985.1 hypothetical protein [Salinibacterium sp. NG22]
MDNILLWVSALGTLTAVMFAAVTAIGTLATAAFTALLWWVAKRALGGTNTQLQLLREQAERDGRPYVTADVVPGMHGGGSWDLVISNSGRSIALDTKFAFDVWPRGGKDDHVSEDLIRFLKEPQTLVPGARKRVVWRSQIKRSGTPAFSVGAPEGHTLVLTYSDELGKQYRTEFSFNSSTIGAAAPMPQEGSRTTAGLGDQRAILTDIDYALRTLNIHVGELRR